MKKFICILAVIAIMLSSVTAVFADAAPASVGLGEVKELLATDYRHVYARPSIGIYTGANGGVTGTTYGGGMYFRFTAPQACEAKLTVKWLPNTSSSWSDFLAFLNPCGAPEAFTCTSAMVEGTDYPARSEAVIDYNFVQSDLTARAAAEGSSNPTYCEKEVVVNLKAGENLFWIPARTLKSMGNDGTVAENAVEPYNQANAQLLVHSLTVEIPEYGEYVPDTVTVYAKDLSWAQLPGGDWNAQIVSGYGNKGLNKSYVNIKEPDNANGFTNIATGNNGDCTTFPFTISKASAYKLKVYYACPENNSKAAVYLDANTSQSMASNWFIASVLGNKDQVKTNIKNFKTVNDTEITPIENGTWYNTGRTVYIDNNGSQADNNQLSYLKAPYFAIKTFDLGTLTAGSHTASFLQELAGESTGNYNNRILINRIEIIPAAASKKVEINTFAYDDAGYKYLNYTDIHMKEYLYDVKTARTAEKDIKLGAQFINNTNAEKTYIPIIAYYSGNTLVNAAAQSAVTLTATANETVTKIYTVPIAELDASVDSIKLFVWENDMITPAHEVTALVD